MFNKLYGRLAKIFQSFSMKENRGGFVSNSGRGGKLQLRKMWGTGKWIACFAAAARLKKMNGNQTIGETRPLKPFINVVRNILLIASLGCFANWAAPIFAQTTNEIRIVELQGKVEISPKGATTWVLTQTNQPVYPFDRLRTGPNSRVALRWSDESVVPFGAQTELEILPPHATDAEPGLHLVRGILSFFHRDKPSRIRVITRGGNAGIEGTEFVMEVTDSNDAELTTLSVFDGKVSFTNEQGALVLTNGQQAVAEPGKAPARTAGFIANNLLQWCFYYPAVLDLNDLSLTTEEHSFLGESLTAYRAGDLLAALEKYPEARQPNSDAGRVYQAALLLSVGQVEKAEAILSALAGTGASEKNQHLAAALRTLIAAVKREENPSILKPQLATELLAVSYHKQSLGRPGALKVALDLARLAVTNSPEFGFGWERVAELEFSFGHTDRALEALNKSLALAPRNAQALALQGFVLAAQNKTRDAIDWFDRALAVDSALGNAWLGRGLCRIRRGDATGGREDLLIAAALEPQRATLRSYLGKAWSDAGDDQRARKELGLAQKLDPNDPTSWLYSALNNERHNRINEAIGDLEKSQELNENRSVYRSGLLLDQDRAVRSANLARIYAEAGMDDVAFREASRAVASDYGNYSAHLFLANSYDSLREQNQATFRYESAAISEYLIGNILAPASAGVFSPAISQQEYSRLFEQNHVGISSTTEYLSRGAWAQSGVINSVSERESIAFEGDYLSDPGQRPNNDLEERVFSLQLKEQITGKDSLYGLVFYSDTWSGDVAQRYDPAAALLDLRTHDEEHPSMILGYHREWAPGIHTLALAGYLSDSLHFNGPVSMPVREFDPFGNMYDAVTVSATVNYHGSLEIFPLELQQIWETPKQTTIVGARFQTGWFKVSNVLSNFSSGAFFPAPVFDPPETRIQFERASGYGYHQLRLGDHLQLIGGLAYDYLQLPENFLLPPVSGDLKSVHQISPKAAFIWQNDLGTVFRGAYTRSIVGASIDQSFELEPAQLAGFTQTYRGVIPDSVEGTTSGAGVSSYGIALEQKLKTGTYLSLSAYLLDTDFTRADGALSNLVVTPVIGSEREHLKFREQSFAAEIDQLLGKYLTVGMQYRWTEADLKKNFVDFPPGFTDFNFDPSPHHTSTLQQLSLHAAINCPSGFFSQVQAIWTHQHNSGFDDAGYGMDEPGDDFWHLDAFVGYRFAQRRAELSFGVLNITDQDYRLEPLTPYQDLPRQRTIAMRLQISF